MRLTNADIIIDRMYEPGKQDSVGYWMTLLMENTDAV